MKRLNKEFSVDIDSKFKTKYGSTNHKKPEVIYIVGNTYISPSFDSNDYVSDINDLKNTYNNIINKLIKKYNTDFHKECICGIDICDNRIKKGKKTFLTFELYLKQKNCKQLNEINDIIKNISEKLVLDFKNNLELKKFTCYRQKKY